MESLIYPIVYLNSIICINISKLGFPRYDAYHYFDRKCLTVKLLGDPILHPKSKAKEKIFTYMKAFVKGTVYRFYTELSPPQE